MTQYVTTIIPNMELDDELLYMTKLGQLRIINKTGEKLYISGYVSEGIAIVTVEKEKQDAKSN